MHFSKAFWLAESMCSWLTHSKHTKKPKKLSQGHQGWNRNNLPCCSQNVVCTLHYVPAYLRPAEPRGQTFSLHLQPVSLLLSRTVIPSAVFSSLIRSSLILHPSTLSCHLLLHQNYHSILYCVLLSTFSLPHFLFYSMLFSTHLSLMCYLSLLFF